jgi:putative nucleotidyltransferase with HDIG domain
MPQKVNRDTIKRAFPLAFIFILSYGLFSFYLFQLYLKDNAQIETRQLTNLKNLYESALITYRLNAHAVFDNIIMQPKVLEVLQQTDGASPQKITTLHDELFQILSARYQNLKNKLNLRQLHFHLPDGKSFLRMHRPNTYGDPLFDVRHSVKLANTNHIYVEGFEEGRIFNGYRYVFPITDNNSHLGSVEISVSISAIIQQLTHIHKQNSFYFMLDKDIFKHKVFEEEKSNYGHSKLSEDFVIDEEVRSRFDDSFEPCLMRLAKSSTVQNNVSLFKAFVRSSHIGKRNIIATFLPIYNVKNVPVAYIVAFENNPVIYSRYESLITQLILTAVLTGTLYSLILYFLLRQGRALQEKIKLDRLVAEKTEELERVQRENLERYRSTILALINLTEERDTYTAGHTRRVADYARSLAESLGYEEPQITKLYEASILHDIGKIVTPDSVLLKPGKLTTREYEIIKEHVIVGESILRHINFDPEIVNIVKYHHERCDGSGYPYRLSCEEIPIMARILAVADTFDAMTTNRIYKPRKSVDISLKELKSLSGTLYDPDIVDQAIKVFQDITIDLTVTQLPTSVIEQERLSHYFKDPLTSLFNIRYLQLMMQFGIEGRFYVCANAIAIQKFSYFNQTQGWEAGNQALVQLAELLESIFQDAMIFRIYGDDFVVLNKNHMDVDIKKLEQQYETLTGIELEFSLMHFDLHNIRQRKSLIQRLESAIG